MSIRRRLWDLARAELNELLVRLGSGAPDDDPGGPADDDGAAAGPRGSSTASRGEQVARAYAALELPPGAPWVQVKSAYRRLMRQYHPDRHQADDEKARIATELAQKLRDAYELLRDELRAG